MTEQNNSRSPETAREDGSAIQIPPIPAIQSRAREVLIIDPFDAARVPPGALTVRILIAGLLPGAHVALMVDQLWAAPGQPMTRALSRSFAPAVPTTPGRKTVDFSITLEPGRRILCAQAFDANGIALELYDVIELRVQSEVANG